MGLNVSGVSGGYGPVPVIHDVSLDVADGESVALLGRNGCGKTTLLRGLMGMLPRCRGNVSLQGVDLTEAPTYLRARAGLGYVPQGREIFPELTVEENLRLGHTLGGRPMRTPIPPEVLAHFEWMHDRLGQLGGTLSGGQQQMLAVARVLVANPKVILLDEPTEGLAPAVIDELAELLGRIVRELHLCVLVVEQNIGFALVLAGRGYIMEKGTIVWSGNGDDLSNDAVVGQYLTI
jgi:branched-chain amino acid transport system ATP-binding protein